MFLVVLRLILMLPYLLISRPVTTGVLRGSYLHLYFIEPNKNSLDVPKSKSKSKSVLQKRSHFITDSKRRPYLNAQLYLTSILPLALALASMLSKCGNELLKHTAFN